MGDKIFIFFSPGPLVMSSSDNEFDPFSYAGSDSDDAPEEVSLSSARHSAEKVYKQQVQAQISINTQRNVVKRKREEAQQARRKTVLPKDLLLSLAEKEKGNDPADHDEGSESDEDNFSSSEDEEEQEEPPLKKSAIRFIDGIEVQADGEAYRRVVKNTGARDFLKNHFYGNRVRRQGYDKNVVRNGLFARNI